MLGKGGLGPVALGTLTAVLFLSACLGGDQEPPPLVPAGAATLQVSSAAFDNGGLIPAKYTCAGEDFSPPLGWDNVPEGVRSMALLVEDPDAPGGTWVHWVLYALPAEARELAEGVEPSETTGGGAQQGTNDFNRNGYSGPCPPGGSSHRYFFRLYALDAELSLGGDAEKADLLKAMEGHILGVGQVMGTYQR
jgi:Raf kinase inhibitor-like YbhB/YbcL family protein